MSEQQQKEFESMKAAITAVLEKAGPVENRDQLAEELVRTFKAWVEENISSTIWA